VVDVEEEGGHFQSGEVAPGTDALGCDVLYGLAGIKPHSLLL